MIYRYKIHSYIPLFGFTIVKQAFIEILPVAEII